MTFLELFFFFAKVGAITFGGGYAMVPFFFDEFVNVHHFLSNTEFANLVALAQMTPGPVGINAATYIGFKQMGLWGAIVATLGMLVPSMVIVMTVSHFLEPFKESKVMRGILKGIRPATIGLIAATVIFFAETSIFTAPLSMLFKDISQFGICWQGVVVFILSLFLQIYTKLNLIWIMLFAMFVTYLLYLI